MQDLISLISFYLLVAIHLLSRVFLLSVLLVLISWSTLASCQVSGLVPANLMASVLAVARGPLPPAVARRVAKSVGPSSVAPRMVRPRILSGSVGVEWLLDWEVLLACCLGSVNLRAGVTSGNRWPALRRLRVAKTSLLASNEFECEVTLAVQGLSFRPSSFGEREGFLVSWLLLPAPVVFTELLERRLSRCCWCWIRRP